VVFILEIETVSLTGVFQRVRAVDEKHGVFYVVFLMDLGEERVSNYAVGG
jgi:hypothetical protein